MNIGIRKNIAKVVNGALHPLGLHLSRYPLASDSPLSFEAMAQRLSTHSIPISTVIDIGASDGRWSKKMSSVYPDASYLLIEANPVHRDALESYVSNNKKTVFTLAAAADRVGEIFFDGSDPLGGTASHDHTENSTASVPCTTVDTEIDKHGFGGPYLLKFDTHGFELPIFDGAAATLGKTDLIVIETYNFNLTGDCLMFWEMCAFLANKGFRPLDIHEPMFRPKDNVFWQVDIVFARADRKVFQSNQYD